MAILRIVNLTAQAARIHARASRSFASSAINQGPRTLATPLASTFIATPKPSQAELAEHYSKFLDGEDIYESNRSKVATHVTHYPVEEVLLESSRADTVLEQVQVQQQQQSNTLAARDAESNSFGNYNSNGNNVYFVDGRVALA